MTMEHNVLELDLARELGLSKEGIRELRKKHLEPGEFALGKNGMCLSEAGADKLRMALGAPEKKCAPVLEVEKKGAPASASSGEGSSDEVALWVRSCPINKRIVLACLKADLSGPVVRVVVKSNVNFIPKMEIKGRLTAETLYHLVGRCPRFRGRF